MIRSPLTQVKPPKAKKLAQPAKEKQIKWISTRPPYGIGIGGYSKSVNFEYKKHKGARVDVVNENGDNLRV